MVAYNTRTMFLLAVCCDLAAEVLLSCKCCFLFWSYTSTLLTLQKFSKSLQSIYYYTYTLFGPRTSEMNPAPLLPVSICQVTTSNQKSSPRLSKQLPYTLCETVDGADLSNYRPISNLPFPGKLLKKMTTAYYGSFRLVIKTTTALKQLR